MQYRRLYQHDRVTNSACNEKSNKEYSSTMRNWWAVCACVLLLLDRSFALHHLLSPRPVTTIQANTGVHFVRASKVMAATTQIVFTPGNKEVTARVGDRMEDVAKAAGMDVQYKCKKGECGTCEVRVNGKWTKACQLTIPTIPKGEVMRVSVTPATARENAQLKTAAKFFSPQSFVEGFINNALGVRTSCILFCILSYMYMVLFGCVLISPL